MHPDYKDIFGAFAAHGVEFLLVGGYAVALLGQPRFTKDLDLWVRPTIENLRRVRRALIDFGAPSDLIEQLDGAGPEDVLWMGAPPVRIDILKGVPGGSFDDAWRDRQQLSWDGVEVPVVSRNELIRLKRASGRPQDLVDAEALERAPG